MLNPAWWSYLLHDVDLNLALSSTPIPTSSSIALERFPRSRAKVEMRSLRAFLCLIVITISVLLATQAYRMRLRQRHPYSRLYDKQTEEEVCLLSLSQLIDNTLRTLHAYAYVYIRAWIDLHTTLLLACSSFFSLYSSATLSGARLCMA